MNKLIFVFAIVAAAALILYFSEPLANAKLQSKIHFTKTITSSPNPAGGQGQFVLLLSPNKGSLYDGSVTFTSTIPIQMVVLHEIDRSDAKGQPTWNVDADNIYAQSVIEPASRANSLEFTGAAVGFVGKEEFTVTASVDGWIRGQPAEVVVQQVQVPPRPLSLADSQLEVKIPMRVGLFAKEPVYYIVTDSSNQTVAEKLSKDWKVKFAPKLRWAPDSSQDLIYVFTNGNKGDGIHGFQPEVFSSTPSQKDSYAPLRKIVFVSWKEGQKPQLLDSVDAIIKAQKESRIKLTYTNITINAPQIVWPGGQLAVTNQTISDEFVKKQVLKIDKDSKMVSLVAHRVWGADGRTLYHIITDAVPFGVADMMGVNTAPKLANVLSSGTFVEMYEFKNGIKGSGPLGFQPSIIDTKFDHSYVPLCRVSTIEWTNPSDSVILQNIDDIKKMESKGKILVKLARPLSEDNILNCPVMEMPSANKG